MSDPEQRGYFRKNPVLPGSSVPQSSRARQQAPGAESPAGNGGPSIHRTELQNIPPNDDTLTTIMISRTELLRIVPAAQIGISSTPEAASPQDERAENDALSHREYV